MQFYRLAEAGFPGLALSEEPIPTPAGNQVLVKMKAVSLNYRDLVIARLTTGDLVPASDGVGSIEAVGDGVAGFSVGDRVAGIFYQDWIDGEMKASDFASGLGGGTVDGTLTQYRLFDADRIVRLPGYLSWHEAATLPCAAVTAWNALEGLEAGQTVLTLGTGGVSIFALQFALERGARVIATSSDEAKEARLREMGASETINYRQVEDWGKRARELTGGNGVDLVVEVGGGGTLAQSIVATRQAGKVSLIGVLSEGEIDPRPILMKSITLRGIQVGSRAMFEELNAFLTKTELRPVIDRVFRFEDAQAAYEYMWTGKHFGKVVIAFD